MLGAESNHRFLNELASENNLRLVFELVLKFNLRLKKELGLFFTLGSVCRCCIRFGSFNLNERMSINGKVFYAFHVRHLRSLEMKKSFET